MTVPVRLPGDGRLVETIQQPGRLIEAAPGVVGPVPGEECPDQGHVLVLAQVAEVVVDGEAPVARPGEGVLRPPLQDPGARPHRGDRAHVRQEVPDVHCSAASRRSTASWRSPSASLSLAIATRHR